MRKFGLILDKSIAYLGYFGAALGVASIAAMIAMITSGVVARYFFDSPLMDADEIETYIFVGLVFMGLAYTARAKAHITITTLIDRLSLRIRNIMQLMTSLILLAVISTYVWYGLSLALDSFNTGIVSITSLATPLWIPQTFIWVGLLILWLQVAADIVKKWAELQYNKSGTS